MLSMQGIFAAPRLVPDRAARRPLFEQIAVVGNRRRRFVVRVAGRHLHVGTVMPS
jgi:hypothetical protein